MLKGAEMFLWGLRRFYGGWTVHFIKRHILAIIEFYIQSFESLGLMVKAVALTRRTDKGEQSVTESLL